MKFEKLWLLLILTFVFPHNKVAARQAEQRVLFTANLVQLQADDEWFNQFESFLNTQKGPLNLVVTGDLLKGNLRGKYRRQDSLRVSRVLELSKHLQDGKLVLLPGDRDWDNSGKNGWKSVRRLEKLVKSFRYKNVKWAIKKGCPGPKIIELDDHNRLVTISTQWWNHPFRKPGPVDADCKIATTDGFQEELEDIIDENSGKNLILTGHFPVFSLGKYGGHFPLSEYLFPLTEWVDWLYLPLPFVGSMEPAYRQNIGGSKDISNENYTPFRKLLKNIISHRSGLVYVSGHERNLQILKKDDNYFLNSGSPRKGKFTADDDDALYASREAGLLELVFYDDGAVGTQVWKYKVKSGIEAGKQFTLYRSACSEETGNEPLNTAYRPCAKELKSTATMAEKYPQPVKTVAGPEYAAGAVHRFFLGDHYRDDWTAEIMVPVLDLDTTFAGLTPYKRGGGRQTRSLKFKAGNGLRYVFRSVNKDPVKALDYELRETIAADIVRDQTTTQHPYGAMAADILLNEADILHAHPKLFVMPDDPKLGPFHRDYAGMLGMLEDLPSNPDEGEVSFAGADRILRSYKLFRNLYRDHDNMVDDTLFARARVLDILMGDWGKHEDNWKWAGYKQGKMTIYKPIPRDRDHVFSRWDGILPWLADREWAKESGENFDYEIVGLPSLVFQARHLDRFIGSRLSKQDWLNACAFVQNTIDEQDIERAVRNMPPETYDLSGREIAAKLKARLRDLQKYIEEFYELLAGEVDVVGSNKREYFFVMRNKDGTVDVTVYNVKGTKNKGNQIYYRRRFFPDETKEIRLYGLDGKDIFYLEGKSDESILVRIIGGPKQDNVYDRSQVIGSGSYTLIYENSPNADIYAGTEAERITTAQKFVYNYDRTAYAYDHYFPLPSLGYNANDGFSLGFGIEYTFQGFGHKPYAGKHAFSVSASTSSSLVFQYDGRYHQLLGDWDLTLQGVYAVPSAYTSFFGFGNETVKDDGLYTDDFYDTRFDSRTATIGLVNEFWKQSSFEFKAHYENNEAQVDQAKTLFGSTDFFGRQKVNMIEAQVLLDLDFRDDAFLPTRGTRLFIQHKNGVITNNRDSNYGITLAWFEHFMTADLLTPVTLGLEAGGGDSYGQIPFYRQLNLGQNNFLRGYLNYRFTGDAIVFMNSDLRFHLADIKSSVIPMRFGGKLFFDSGRVIQSGENSDKWHNGYGFGFYLVPLEKSFTLNVSAGFSEEESMLIKFALGTVFK